MSHESTIYTLKNLLSNIEGQREIVARLVEADRDLVGKAKQRESIQPGVVASLEQLQKQEHERAVGVFSRLLTALVKDVLPNTTKPVVLDLYTSHGVPALDIDIAAGEKNTEEITSGAVKNILSVGLRLIAIARTKQRRFLVLDEPDHWIKLENVPQFASVLDRIMKELGFQILMISHHPASFFNNVAKCVNITKVGDELSLDGDMMPEEHNGLKAIRLVNFESHSDTIIPLHAGMTILTGENNIGKSSVIRALKSLLVGEMCKDRVIKHTPKEEPFSRVEIKLENDEWVGLRRARKLNQHMRHKNRFYVRKDDVASDDEQNFLIAEDTSDEVPEFIRARTKIQPNDKWTIHVAAQEESVFLLNQTTKATERAKILALGNEAEVLHAMIEKNRKDSGKDKEVIREGEKRLAASARVLEMTKSVCESVSPKLVLLESQVKRIDQDEAALENGKAILIAMKQSQQTLTRLKSQLSILGKLSPPPQVDFEKPQKLFVLLEDLKWSMKWSKIKLPSASVMVEPTLNDVRSLKAMITSLKAAGKKAVALPQMELPNEPLLKNENDLSTVLDGLLQRQKEMMGWSKEAEDAQAELLRVEAELQDVWGELKECPLCGTPHESSHKH